jgi:O-antigen ligase/Tfp pilus assembly protein PilF
LLLLAALMLLQITPLPPGLVRFLSPTAYAYYQPLLDVYPKDAWLTLSLNSSATLQHLLLFVTGILLYISVILLFAKNLLLRPFIVIFVIVATAIAVLAIIQRVVTPDMLLFIRKTPAGMPFGPWINPNQFCGYIELVAPLALGLCMFYRPRRHHSDNHRERFIHFFSTSGTNKHLWLLIILFIMILAATLTLSRGGIASLFCSLLLFQILYLSKKRSRSYFGVTLLVFAFCLVFTWVGWGSVSAEFNQTVDTKGNIRDDRITLWSDSARLIGDFPVFGSGFGSFVNVYPLYKTLKNPLVYEHPHNEYFETLTDGGIIGAALVLWFLAALFRHAWKNIRLRRNRYPILLGIAGLSGISATLMHGVTDFNMHNPAIFLLFYLLCGLTVATVNIRFEMNECRTLLPVRPLSSNAFYGASSVLAIAAVALLLSGQAIARHMEGKNAQVYVSPQLKRDKLESLVNTWRSIVHLDPLESRHRYQLASIEWYLGEKSQAARGFWRAAMLNPMEGAYLQRVGYLQDNAQVGKRLILDGAKRSLRRSDLAASLAEYLLRTGEQSEAVEIIKKSLAEEPSSWKKWIILMDSYSFPPEDIADLLPPEEAGPWFNIGSFRMQSNRPDDARPYFTTALEIMERHEREVYPEYWHSQICAYFARAGQAPEMLGRALRLAMQNWPYVLRFRMQLGDYYLAQGFTARAIDAYRSVLEIHPRYPAAVEKLKELRADIP